MTALTPLSQHSSPPNASVAQGVALAFIRAVKSQLHPRMIFALFLPVIATLVFAIVLLWFGWTPLTEWLSSELSGSAVPGAVDPWLGTAGFMVIKAWLIPIAAAFILLPLAGIVGLAVAAIWVMPMVLAHVGSRNYPDIQAQGRHTVVLSVWNALWVSLVFIVGWLVTLPLWLIAPLGLILSVFWWTYAFTRIMRLEAMIDHASPQERQMLLRDRNTGFWLLGLICALLNLIPPAWVFLPVFSGLLFAHYSFESLRQLRARAV
jgi:hypothetical protein